MKPFVALLLCLAVLPMIACSSKRKPGPTQPNQLPIAVASVNLRSGVAPLLVKFGSTGSSDPDGEIRAYSWNFGDGAPSIALAFTSHTYASAGDFVATLTVVDNDNGVASDTLHIAVVAAPPRIAPGNSGAAWEGRLSKQRANGGN